MVVIDAEVVAVASDFYVTSKLTLINASFQSSTRHKARSNSTLTADM